MSRKILSYDRTNREKNRACARLEREDRSEMKRYFCAFLLLVLLTLTACEGAPTPVTADSRGGGSAASDRSAEGCAHEPVTDPRAAPTCTEPGRTEGTHCARCGAVLTAQEEIPAAGHKPSAVQRREPTCTEDGFEGESKCSVCGEVLAEARTLPVLGHTTDNGKCTRCGEQIGGIWNICYYVDKFDQPTDAWYVSTKKFFVGKFSNSAVTDETLYAAVLADAAKVTIFLYEYGSHQVRNYSSQDWDEYIITMRTDDGDFELTGAIPPAGDRIIIDEPYTSAVLEALRGEGTVLFHIVPVKAWVTETEYLFSVEPSNFASEYGRMTGAEV